MNVSAVPIGTIAEAEKEGLDPTVYATCARPNKVTGLVGCQWFDKCRVSAKGQAGPKNYGCDYYKGKAQGGVLVKNTFSCMWIADHIEDIEKNGGALKVIAEEGDTYEKVTGIAVDNMTGKPTMNVRDPNTHREDRRIEIKVEPWPRPGQNPDLIHDMLRAETIRSEKERKSDESLARAIGDIGSIAPLDKREGKKPRG